MMLNLGARFQIYTIIVLSLFFSSTQAYVLGPTAKWGSDLDYGTPGGVVTYSFMATGTTCDTECSPSTSFTALNDFLPVGWESEIERAFDTWASVADISFLEVADGGEAFNLAGSSGDIRFGGHTFDGARNVLAHGYYPPPNGLTAAGDIHFDIDENWQIGAGSGFDIFTVALHEIGHAIGLGHSNVADAVMGAFYTGVVAGLHADDIAGAQFIYGPAVVPLPAAFWLLLSALGMVAGFARRH